MENELFSLREEYNTIRVLVSVVIPVYNVKDYLKKCLQSVINQTYGYLEIILVDDGSTDGSSEICDEFAQKDSRISVLHKKNGGLGSARKAGIRVAKGKFLVNIDSDDWIEPNMIQELLLIAIKNDADMVTSGYYREEIDATACSVDTLDSGLYGESEKEYLYSHLIFNNGSEKMGVLSNLVNKLIKTSILNEVYLKFNDDIIWGEDGTAVYASCVLADKIVVTHNIYYHYVMRHNSLVHSYSCNYFRSLNEVYLLLKYYFEKSIYRDVLVKQLDLFVVKMAFMGINYWGGLCKEVSIPYYDFKKDSIEKNARVILYGAGQVGQAFYKQICAEGLYELVAWVDRNYLKYQEQKMKVKPIETIYSVEFDYVILAFKYKEMADDIKKVLEKEYGIELSKLVWLEPISILDKYCLTND